MRPTDVSERIQELFEREEAEARAKSHHALRQALTSFIHGCALLGYDDVGVSAVLDAYRIVLAKLDDPAQARTGSRLEAASIECVAEMPAGSGLR